MDSFKIFAENTNWDFFLISIGMALLCVASFSNIVFGNKLTLAIKIISIITLSYAAFILLTQLRSFFDITPNFFGGSQYLPYRQNIYAGCGLCSILFVLIIYATYSVFF
jgi:hypothetical protein